MMKKIDTNVKYHIYFILTVTFGVVLRLMYYMGPSGADDMIYFGVVKKLLLGEDIGEALTSSMHWGIRTGFVLPVWLSMHVFGVSEFSFFFFSLVTSAGVMLFLYMVGTRLFHAKAGLLAALSYTILPQDVYLSTVGYPDGPVVLFSALFVYLFYQITQEKKVSIPWSGVTGLMLALCYLIRETSVMLLIFVPVFFFLASKKKVYIWSVAFLCVGFFLGLNLEMGLLWGLTDNPFARFEILTGQTNILTPGAYTFHPRWHSFFLDPFILILGTYWMAPMITSVLLGIVLLAVTPGGFKSFSLPKSHFLWMLIISLVIWACYAYTPVIGFTKPLDRSERYFHIMMPFAALTFGVLLYEFMEGRGVRRVMGCLVIVFYTCSCLFSLSVIVNKNSHGIDFIEKFITENSAESYLVPAHLKPAIQFQKGLNFMENKIIPYPYDEKELFPLLADAARKNTTQYLFHIPQMHEIQLDFEGHMRLPYEKLKFLEKFNTPEGQACRLLHISEFIYKNIPGILTSKICYTTKIEVYQLKR